MPSATLLDRRPAADWLEHPGRTAATGPLPFVTISRLAGAGGDALAEALASRLSDDPELGGPIGWQTHDADVCAEIASDPELASRLEDLVREVYRPGLEDFTRDAPRLPGARPIPVHLIFRTVRHLATVGYGIIVGRAGVLLTRDLPLGVHVRLIAPREERLERMRTRFRLTREEALSSLEDQDGSRARLFRDYFQRDIDDPQLYDAVLNTGRISMEAAANVVVELLRDRVESARGAGPSGAPAGEAAP